jgi:hypothetical protein
VITPVFAVLPDNIKLPLVSTPIVKDFVPFFITKLVPSNVKLLSAVAELASEFDVNILLSP